MGDSDSVDNVGSWLGADSPKTTAVKDGAADVRGTIAAGRHFADRNGKVGHVQEMYMLDDSFGVIRVWCVRLRVWDKTHDETTVDTWKLGAANMDRQPRM